MPSDTPAQDTPGAPAPKVDFTAAMAKVKALAAKLGNSASNTTPQATTPSAPGPAKRPYEEDSYSQGHDSHSDENPYGKRMAYDSGRDSTPVHRPGLGAQVSHYAPPMRNEHNIQEEMPVPGNLVGLIIGRGGENLKRIERETGCRVQFSQDGNPGDRERFVNIIGQPAGIADAKRQIQEIITSSQTGDRHGNSSYGGGGYGAGNYGMGGGGGGGAGYGRGGTTATIQIPSTKVGLVIGRGGETIRDLQDRSGARIAVTPPHDHSSPSRTVSITGDDGAIERAKAFIEEIVNDMAPRGNYGGSGGGGGGYQSTPPVTMTVPQESIGLVIGRGGETVKQLQIQSRAKIQVQQVDPGLPPPADRTINLFGPPEAVEYAKQLIMEKVAGARDNDRYGGQRDQSGYGSGGSYGGYQQQQQQYQQPAQSSASSGYGQYGSYTAPAATGAASSTTGYTPEQQAAYAQYYGYQYGAGYQYGTTAPAAAGTAATTASSGADAAATPATASADASAYGTYDYSRYLAGQYGTTASTTTTSSAPAAPATSAVGTSSAGAAAPTTTDASAVAATGVPDYSAYYAQQGYNSDAYQQYYSQYYGYQASASTGTGADSTSAAATTTAPATDSAGSTDPSSSNNAGSEQSQSSGNEPASS
ncbi:hypothetical protein BGX21_002855 [Mortierella sp. AD011]|nr:hypothetical protein BGX20_002749 [Mortierella sp. AD010]KAF9378616.1 hypothetical protein BGX21_002855 [Mortierella sp. AD011]